MLRIPSFICAMQYRMRLTRGVSSGFRGPNRRNQIDSNSSLLSSSLSILAATTKRFDGDLIDWCKKVFTRRLVNAFSHPRSREVSHSKV